MSEPAAFPWAKRGGLRGKSKEPVMCCAFSTDDSTLFVGYYDGILAAFDVHTLSARLEMTVQHGTDKPSGVSAIAVNPTGRPQMLVAAGANVHRLATKSFEELHVLQQPSEVYNVSFSSNAVNFATCGRDAVIRVFREADNTVIREVHVAPEYPANVAALRLYSVHFDPANPSRLFAGGWGNTIYEVNLGDAVKPGHENNRREFFGAFITGDCLDAGQGTLVSASHRLEDRLQLWDVESGKPSAVAWPVKNNFLPNCARLSPDGRFLACGGGGGQGLTPGFFVLDMTAHKPVVDLTLDKSVSACCFATKSALVALGDMDAGIQLYENRFEKRAA